MHPAELTPTARALYWYLLAIGVQEVEVTTAAAESGIPRSSIYEAVRRYPEVFEVRGSSVHTIKGKEAAGIVWRDAPAQKPTRARTDQSETP